MRPLLELASSPLLRPQFFGKCRFSMHERVPLLEGLRLDAVKTIPANFALGWLCYAFERASIGNDDRTS